MSGGEAMSREHYEELVGRVRAMLCEQLPEGATALVVSNGDGRLVALPGYGLGHFPQTPTGLYAGHHPADGNSALHHLLALQADGAQYFVLPAPYRWWLGHYGELAAWLEAHASIVAEVPSVATVFSLQPQRHDAATVTSSPTAPQVSGLLEALLPRDAGVVLIGVDVDQVDVGERRRWDLGQIGQPGASPIAEAGELIADAARHGASFAALVVPADRSSMPDARIQAALQKCARLLCRQRLVEVYELRDGARP